MEQVLHVFGIDWKLLLINAVNFGLLLAALSYFFYKPMMRMLDERRDQIAQGVKDAESAKQELSSIEGARSTMLAKAGKEADEVVSQARSLGSQKEREIIASAEAVAARALKEAEAQAKDMKENAIAESKEEVAKLIVLGMEKALKTK